MTDAKLLPYFPLYAGDWLAGEATAMMLPEQEGAFIRLLCISWRSQEIPCSLPNDDRALAHMSRLYDRWTELGPLVKAQFEVVDGRLRNPKLWDVYTESQVRHSQRVEAGRTGGKAGGGKPKKKPRLSNAKAELKPSSSEAQAEPKQEEEEAYTKLTTTASSSERDGSDVSRLLDGLPDDTVRQTWLAELRVAKQGMHGKPLTAEQINRACRDYVGAGHLSNKPSLRHFRAFLENAGKPQRAPIHTPRLSRQEVGRQHLADAITRRAAERAARGEEPQNGI